MRRTAIAAVSCAVLLAGCSGTDSSSTQKQEFRPLPAPTISVSRERVPASVTTDAELPTVSGRFGHKATITIPHAKPSGKFVVTALAEGQGHKAQNGDVVIVDYTAKTWKSTRPCPAPTAKAMPPRCSRWARER
ncbi:hypothetical protein ACFWWT_40045 [Streptomyces sp. NPDC058676]|uniref:hypothetical protein n=1 Tax=Streptomyces sp. NPDC058676 TaxID=3346593 RepID=UPI003660B7B5